MYLPTKFRVKVSILWLYVVVFNLPSLTFWLLIQKSLNLVVSIPKCYVVVNIPIYVGRYISLSVMHSPVQWLLSCTYCLTDYHCNSCCVYSVCSVCSVVCVFVGHVRILLLIVIVNYVPTTF